MLKRFIYLLPLLALYGCPPPCERSSSINNGSLADSALILNPYNNDSVYKFKHSKGHVIEFQCKRETYPHDEFWGYECGKHISYEINRTQLTPNYPLPFIDIQISNPDSAFNKVNIGFGRSYFEFGQSKTLGLIAERTVKTIVIDDVEYSNVLILKDLSYNWQTNDKLADSLYYNIEKGIIKIFLTNGETFTALN